MSKESVHLVYDLDDVVERADKVIDLLTRIEQRLPESVVGQTAETEGVEAVVHCGCTCTSCEKVRTKARVLARERSVGVAQRRLDSADGQTAETEDDVREMPGWMDLGLRE